MMHFTMMKARISNNLHPSLQTLAILNASPGVLTLDGLLLYVLAHFLVQVFAIFR
jgi:hypothetical protein